MLSLWKRSALLVSSSALAVTATIHSIAASVGSIADSAQNSQVETTRILSSLNLEDFDGRYTQFKGVQVLNRNYATILGDFYKHLMQAGIPEYAAAAMTAERFTSMVMQSELEPEFEDADWEDE